MALIRMSRHFSHVTLDTGDHYHSPESAITQGVIDLVSPHLAEALTHPAPIPSVPGYFLRATAHGTSLVATVLRQATPVLTFGVALQVGGAAELWQMLHDEHLRPTGSPPLRTRPSDIPLVPWCAVLFLNHLEVVRASEWIGDNERCVTWAWIENAVLDTPGHAVMRPQKARETPRTRFVKTALGADEDRK